MMFCFRKRLMVLTFALSLVGFVHAEEVEAGKSGESEKTESTQQIAEDSSKAQNAQAYVPPATSFYPMLTILSVYLPNNDMIDLKIPYFMPMVHGRFSHRFTEFRKNPEVEFIADGEIAPLWLRAGAQFQFKPLPFLSLGVGSDIGTSWGLNLGFLDLDFIGRYDGEKNEYEYFSPFTHWTYDFWANAAVNFDIGSLLTKGKQHFIVGGSYKAIYRGMTGIENKEIWLDSGIGENANGLSYSATANMNYIVPNKYFNSVGFSATASGYYSESFFDEKYRVSDPTFVNLTFTLNASASIGPKNRFLLMLPVSGKRNFCDDKNLRPITEPNGRKWQWDGIILTFTHIF